MHFIIRNGDYMFAENPLPTDNVLTVNSNDQFQKYVEEMKVLCGNYSGCKFPQSYFGNVRPWDYEQILEHGNFTENDLILECGGLHTYFAIALSQKVKHYTCTDSFYWATRDYAKNDKLQSPKEWCGYLISKGKGKLWAEEADLQKMKYSDNSFDHVINISVIEHVHNDRQGIEEMVRVLKPGGTLLLTTEYNPNWSKDYAENDGSYYRVYDKEGIKKLLDGFNVEIMKSQSEEVPIGHFTTLFIKIKK